MLLETYRLEIFNSECNRGAFSHAAAGFKDASDPFGGFYWMLKTYLSRRKP